MADEEKVILSTATSLFIQFEPGKEVYYLGTCTGLDEISNPRGGFDPIVCRDGKGAFQILGEKPSPPDLISFTIERLHARTASWIDQANCPFTVFALQRCEGNEGIFANWITGQVVHKAHLVNDTVSNISQRDSSDEMLRSYEVVARPPRVDLWEILTSQKSTTEVTDLNAITSPLYSTCGEGCSQQIIDPCNTMAIGCDAGAGVSANVLVSQDGGQTWAASAADPFGVNLNITALKSFMLDARTVRLIAFRMTLAGTPLQMSYSDNLGASWASPVNVGSTNAEAVNSPNALCIYDADQMWVGTSTGRIYKSVDGGLTWEEQTSALVASGGAQINCIDFFSPKFGVAGGAGDVIIYTIDGGVNWTAASATGSGNNILDIEVHSRSRWSAGTSGGHHYMSYDGGGSWVRLNNFPNAGTGSVRAFAFPEGDEMNGYMIHVITGGVGRVLRTIDGGNSWKLIQPNTGPNGLNDLLVCNPNHVFAVGDDDGTRGVILEAGIV